MPLSHVIIMNVRFGEQYTLHHNCALFCYLRNQFSKVVVVSPLFFQNKEYFFRRAEPPSAFHLLYFGYVITLKVLFQALF